MSAKQKTWPNTKLIVRITAATSTNETVEGRQPGSQVPELERICSRSPGSGPFSCCTTQYGPRGVGSGFGPQQGVKWSTTNIVNSKIVKLVLLIYSWEDRLFCFEGSGGKEGPGNAQSNSASTIYSLPNGNWWWRFSFPPAFQFLQEARLTC